MAILEAILNHIMDPANFALDPAVLAAVDRTGDGIVRMSDLEALLLHIMDPANNPWP